MRKSSLIRLSKMKCKSETVPFLPQAAAMAGTVRENGSISEEI